ncbi:MAG: hypothetical protein IPO32_08410 [Crocinitomicaceae bacterium]|jgi:hypothetical protein|nr:hypothetical protein [Crocinitomicaceae bacterium]
MRSIIVLLYLFGINSFSIGQAQKEWTLYKSIQGVNVSFQEMSCSTNDAPAQVAYIIKFENTTNQSLTISWDLAVWYNNEKLSHDVSEGENHYVIDLLPNQTVLGDCSTPFGALYIFKDFITYVSPTKLTKFEFENLQVAIK